MEARYLTDLEWRICHAVNIYVFRNGRDGEQPVLVHIPPSKKKNMRTVMNVIQDRVKYPVGYAKFLYKMDGTRIKDPCELEMYNNYVVASNFDKYFKCAAYGRKRSPLLVLNRESKHVRVLKLQNQNYYEWLLKKKAVGEERPSYIYPAYYTNENLRPQDLPLGNMGNFHPAEVQAPGCCYPREGGKTYRVDGGQNYVVNTVTVDVTPELGDLNGIRRRKRSKQFDTLEKRLLEKHRPKDKIKERTPSDMINANVVASSGTSQEVVSVGTSETEEQVKISNKVHHSGKHQHSHRKSKSHRVHHAEPSEEQQVKPVSSDQSSEDVRKHHKKGNKKTKKKDRDLPLTGGMLPPPPLQFRDEVDICNNNISLKHQGGDAINNQDILKYVDRAINNPTLNLASISPTKTFFYSPEKLAEINSSGNIQPFELTFANQQQSLSVPPGQWALIRQPQQQLVPQLYAIDSHSGQNATGLLQAPDSSVGNSQQSGVIASYSQPQNHQIVQNFPIQHRGLQQFQSVIQGNAMSSSSSSQPVYHSQLSVPAGQCVVIPTNNMSQQPLQSGNVTISPTTQLLALPGPTNHNQMQQVYQLGIVQQPNPQRCIQVDARAVKQYVDNQKIIEARFQLANKGRKKRSGRLEPPEPTDRRSRRNNDNFHHSSTDQTESEVDIPFTPLKTYRLKPERSTESPPPPLIDHRKHHNSNKGDERSVTRPRHRYDRLPKIKSRNVAIQMGFPGASARASRKFNFAEHLIKGAHSSDISFILDRSRNSLNNDLNSGRRFSSSNCMLESSSPRPERDRIMFPSTNRDYRSLRRSNNFGTSFSDHYLSLHNSRVTNSDKFHDTRVHCRTARHRLSDPIVDELVTIPPPTEFRESVRYPGRTRTPQDNYNDKPTHSTNHKYPYTNNDRNTLQYMYDQYA